MINLTTNNTGTKNSNGSTIFSTNKSNNQENKNQRLKLTPVKMEFPNLIATLYNDTIGLCQLINGLLRPVFSNYHGSKIEVVQNRQLYTSIFFMDTGKDPEPGQYVGIERIIDKNSLNNADARIDAINRFNNLGVRKFYRLSKEAKELLQDIIPTQFINKSNNSVDWDKIVNEGTYQGQYNQSQIIVQVVVDLVRIIKCIYGERTSDGGYWNYQINIGAPINPINTPVGGVIANKWQIFIMRVNSKDVNDLAIKYGYNYGGNDMGIITQ